MTFPPVTKRLAQTCLVGLIANGIGACTPTNAKHEQPLLEAAELQQALQQSRRLAQSLGKELKTTLMAAVKKDGLAGGIQACNTQAPAISEKLQTPSAFSIARTSLKLRNSHNAPDNWEQEQLLKFDQGQESEAYLITRINGKPALRYMKAIPTAGICLNCHGKTLADPVSKKLKSLYPHDKAVGYQTGEIRGAFTITRYL